MNNFQDMTKKEKRELIEQRLQRIKEGKTPRKNYANMSIREAVSQRWVVMSNRSTKTKYKFNRGRIYLPKSLIGKEVVLTVIGDVQK